MTFWLVKYIRSTHDKELFTTCPGLSIICVDPADSVRESSYVPIESVISFSHHFELRALKLSAVRAFNTAQKMVFSLTISLVNVTKSAVSCRFGQIN